MLIHVGLHKCGSTWLQKNLFSRPGAGFCAPWGGMSHLAVTEFVAIDPLTFDPAASRRKFDDARRAARAATGVAVLSHEALSSRPHHGAYYAAEVARRLKQTFPEAKLLMIFREQVSMIHSLYGEHVRNGGRHTLGEFIGVEEPADGFAPLCKLSFFEYDRLVAMYRGVFGDAAVLALPLELLRARPDAFAERIFAFAGVAPFKVDGGDRPNVSWGPLTTELHRRSNGLIRRSPLGRPDDLAYRARSYVAWRLDRVIPKRLNASLKARQVGVIRDKVGDFFQAGNHRLSAQLGLDLQSMGYGVRSTSGGIESRRVMQAVQTIQTTL